MVEQVTINKEEETTSEKPVEEQSTQSKPEGLPEKFNSVEDLAKSYSELEKKLGEQTPKEEVDPTSKATLKEDAPKEQKGELDIAEKAVASAGLNMETLSNEYAEKGWEVTAHLMRMPVKNPPIDKAYVLKPDKLSSEEVPLEVEVNIYLPQTENPEIDSVQSIWEGADWNEKETWDLVGIKFKNHEKMMRVLNPHDSPAGFHPLQKQHKIRYNDHFEMYDDPQGFQRKPIDDGRTK